MIKRTRQSSGNWARATSGAGEKGRRGEGEKGRRGEGERGDSVLPFSLSPLLPFSRSPFLLFARLHQQASMKKAVDTQGRTLAPPQPAGEIKHVDGFLPSRSRQSDGDGQTQLRSRAQSDMLGGAAIDVQREGWRVASGERRVKKAFLFHSPLTTRHSPLVRR